MVKSWPTKLEICSSEMKENWKGLWNAWLTCWTPFSLKLKHCTRHTQTQTLTHWKVDGWNGKVTAKELVTVIVLVSEWGRVSVCVCAQVYKCTVHCWIMWSAISRKRAHAGKARQLLLTAVNHNFKSRRLQWLNWVNEQVSGKWRQQQQTAD